MKYLQVCKAVNRRSVEETKLDRGKSDWLLKARQKKPEGKIHAGKCVKLFSKGDFIN